MRFFCFAHKKQKLFRFFLLRFMRLTRTWRTKNNSKTTKHFAVSEREKTNHKVQVSHIKQQVIMFCGFFFFTSSYLTSHSDSLFSMFFSMFLGVHNTPSSSRTLLTYSNCAKEFSVKLLLLNESSNNTHNWVKKSPLARLSWWIFPGLYSVDFIFLFLFFLGCCF
jgi:hypothetical protein